MLTRIAWVIYVVPSGKTTPMLLDRPKLFYASLVEATPVMMRADSLHPMDTHYIQQVHVPYFNAPQNKLQGQ
jgi:hypothetical protein